MMEHGDGSVLRVRRVEIVDSQGRVRIGLGTEKNSFIFARDCEVEEPCIELFDGNGELRWSLGVNSTTSEHHGMVDIAFYSGVPNAAARLTISLSDDEAQIHLGDEAGITVSEAVFQPYRSKKTVHR